jgi:large subunit ribosomal protein L3
VQNLVVVRVDPERQLLLIKGSVPGAAGRDVIVRPAVKR